MLQDKVVIVSGIGPGMGRDISLACAREGADIVLAARTPAKLEAVAPEVEALGRRALSVPTDVTKLHFRRLAAERGVDEQTVHDEAAAESALGRLATSAEIAEAVVFFASDRSRAITGQSLDVNCGSFFA